MALELVQDLGGAQPAAPQPPPTVGPAQALEAPGVQIALITGERVSLRYSMLSLARLEAEFGSLQGLGDRFAAMTPPEEPAKPAAEGEEPPPVVDAKIFTELVGVLAPGLIHVRMFHPDSGQRVRLGEDRELCAELLSPGELVGYLRAFQAALAEAFGALMQGGPPAGLEGLLPRSPGAPGTTPPPSPSADPTATSGA